MSKFVGTKASKAYQDKLNRVKQIVGNIPEYGQLDDAMLAAIYAEGDILAISGCVGLEKGAMKEKITHMRVLGESNGEYLVECNGRVGFTSKEKIYAALDIPVEEVRTNEIVENKGDKRVLDSDHNSNGKVECKEDR